MAFVQVPHFGCDAEGLQRADATGSKYQFLMEAHLAASDIQDVGDRPVRLGVVGNVRVQQQHRDASHLDEPYRREQVALGQLDGNRECLAVLADDAQDRQLRQVVVRVGVLLVTVRVDRLAEVPMLVQQTDADERHGHVARRLDVVTGQNTETAGVDAQALVEAVLGAEVAYRALHRGAVFPVEPVLAAAGHVAVELGEHLGVLGHEGRVVEQLSPGDRLRQDFDRIPISRP